MAIEEHPSSPKRAAHRMADRLALALEAAGFDVGREFPMLSGTLDSQGTPIVGVGEVGETTANRLSAVLSDAARLGVTAEDE